MRRTTFSRTTTITTNPIVALAMIAMAVTTAACERDRTATDADEAARLTQLRSTVEALEQRRTRLEDERQIKRVQHAFGYYIDRGLWDEAADLFADSGTIEFGLDGVYVGRERVREYLHATGGGRPGLADGILNEHIQFMPVVTVAQDGTRAQARWRNIIMGGEHGGDAYWGEGPYENEYVKQDGVWKIARLHWFQTVVVPYEHGWMNHEDLNGGIWVSDELPPDRPPSMPYETWPNTFLPPFHFPNPVTGE